MDDLAETVKALQKKHKISEETAVQLIIAQQLIEMNQTSKDLFHFIRTPEGGML